MTLNLTLQILDAFEKLPPERRRTALALAKKLAAENAKTDAARRKPAQAKTKKK